MAIEHYVGTSGPTIEGIATEQELYEAVDVLHTLVMDGLGEDHPALRLLSDLMDEIMKLYPEVEPS